MLELIVISLSGCEVVDTFMSSVVRVPFPIFVYIYVACKAAALVLSKHVYHYTPGIYAEGYIVFVFPFVCSFVRLFVRSFASKFCVKVSQVVYISATTHQKAFIFGP